MIKSLYILDILNILLDDEKIDVSIRKQIYHLTETDFEYTGVGVFVSFEANDKNEKYESNTGEQDLILDGVRIINEDKNVFADAILFFNKGIISSLEIINHYGDYPESDLENYTLKQIWTGSKGKMITR